MTADFQRPTTLAGWLHWQENLHPRRMDMGLERVREVAKRLGLIPFPARIITVGGTNGKGSTVLLLEALLRDRHHVGTYTSPHLQRYTERIRIGGAEVEEAALCRACAAVEQARAETPLTYFEFGTLAALWVFHQAGVDTALLEVGMGGRLDATNALDPDVAVITSIALDHCDWLGPDRESIATEKAGILRAGVPAICADRDPPDTMRAAAAETGAELRLIGREFDLVTEGDSWHWHDWQHRSVEMRACPGVLPANLAAALAALTAFGEPANADDLVKLADFAAPGRRQIVSGSVELVFDVGHNAEAARVFADWLAAHPAQGAVHAVLGMLVGKPVEPLVRVLSPHVDVWYSGGLPQTDRGLTGEVLAREMPTPAEGFVDVAGAFAAARAQVEPGDRIIVCGSFYTVGAIMDGLETHELAA